MNDTQANHKFIIEQDSDNFMRYSVIVNNRKVEFDSRMIWFLKYQKNKSILTTKKLELIIEKINPHMVDNFWHFEFLPSVSYGDFYFMISKSFREFLEQNNLIYFSMSVSEVIE